MGLTSRLHDHSVGGVLGEMDSPNGQLRRDVLGASISARCS